MALSIMTFSIIITKRDTQHNGRALLCWVLFLLSVTCKPFMLSVIMLNFVAQSTAGGWTRTLDLARMKHVFCHCAITAGQVLQCNYTSVFMRGVTWFFFYTTPHKSIENSLLICQLSVIWIKLLLQLSQGGIIIKNFSVNDIQRK
jgi:hypothetical protein